MNTIEYLLVISETIDKIDLSRKSLIEDQERLKLAHVSWKNNDSRFTVYAKCIHVLNATKLGLRYIENSLRPDRDEFWKEYYETEPQLSWSGKEYINQYETMLRLGFLQFIFSAIESTFRLMLLAVEPPLPGSKPISNFRNVYEHFLKLLGLDHWKPFLHLLRNCRNALHNNNVFSPESGNDDIVSYKGINYEFKVGNKVNFLNWAFFVDLLDDMPKMLLEVIDHSKIISLSSIDDPSL
jgi:hypothetical protein